MALFSFLNKVVPHLHHCLDTVVPAGQISLEILTDGFKSFSLTFLTCTHLGHSVQINFQSFWQY